MGKQDARETFSAATPSVRYVAQYVLYMGNPNGLAQHERIRRLGPDWLLRAPLACASCSTTIADLSRAY